MEMWQSVLLPGRPNGWGRRDKDGKTNSTPTLSTAVLLMLSL